MSQYLHRPQNRMAACMSMGMGGVPPEEGVQPIPEGKVVMEPPAQRLYRVGMAAAVIVAASATFAQGSSNGGGGPTDNQVCQGPNAPGTVVNDTAVGAEEWLNPSNAAASDDSRAVADSTIGDLRQTNYLKATSFGFSVPSGATITSITVFIERHKLEPTYVIEDNIVSLVKGGAVVGDNNAKADQWPDADATAEYAGILWGTTWTPAEINASNFGVVLSVNLRDGATFEPAKALVDAITLEVCYNLPSAGDDPTDGRPIIREPRRTITYPSGVVINAQPPPEEPQTANIAPLIVQPPRVAARAPEGAYWISQPQPEEPVVDAFMPPGLIQVDTPKPFIDPRPVLSIPVLQGGVVALDFRPHGWQFNLKNADHALRILTSKHPYARRSIVRAVGNGTNGIATGVVQIDWLNGFALAYVPDNVTGVEVGDTVFSIATVDGTGRSDAPTFLVLAKIAGSGDQIAGDFCGT